MSHECISRQKTTETRNEKDDAKNDARDARRSNKAESGDTNIVDDALSSSRVSLSLRNSKLNVAPNTANGICCMSRNCNRRKLEGIAEKNRMRVGRIRRMRGDRIVENSGIKVIAMRSCRHIVPLRNGAFTSPAEDAAIK